MNTQEDTIRDVHLSQDKHHLAEDRIQRPQVSCDGQQAAQMTRAWYAPYKGRKARVGTQEGT